MAESSSKPGMDELSRLKRFEFDRKAVSRPPREIAMFIRKIEAEERKKNISYDRRGRKRVKLNLEAVCLELDEKLQPIGEPFMVVTRNISVAGIALIHTRSTRARYLVLELPSEMEHGIQLVAEVVYCRPNAMLYEVGCRIVARPSANAAPEPIDKAIEDSESESPVNEQDRPSNAGRAGEATDNDHAGSEIGAKGQPASAQPATEQKTTNKSADGDPPSAAHVAAGSST